MPYHVWGDTDFDWAALHYAMRYIGNRCRRLAGIHVMMKEKYGTIRYEFVELWGWSKYRLISKYQVWVFRGTVYRASKLFPQVKREIIDDLWFMF